MYSMACCAARAGEFAGLFYGGSGKFSWCGLSILVSFCKTRTFSIVIFCELKCCGFLRVTPTMEGDVSEHGAPEVKSNSNNWHCRGRN